MGKLQGRTRYQQKPLKQTRETAVNMLHSLFSKILGEGRAYASIVEQSLEWNSPLYLNFIDYEKAFDSVDREALWKLLRHYGVPGKIISLIQCTYQDMSCRISHAGQLSESFEVKTGVRQGCLLSPFLFLLVIDWIMKTTTAGREKRDTVDSSGRSWMTSTSRTTWRSLSHSHSQMQDKTTCLEATSARTGLKNQQEENRADEDQHHCQHTSHSRSALRMRNMEDNEDNVAEDPDISQHGLRRIFNIRWPEKIRNEELWERAGQEPVAKQILRRKDAINSMLEDPFLHMSSDGVEIQILGEDILSSSTLLAADLWL
nr:hypothetical protein BaRGS_012262 [Batillaria attramentaria]